MNQIHFADNMINLRRSRNITQEQLADFLGITKASVSKWENKQSMPDIMLLPQIATFFDVTIDELIGYEPWLSKAQIQKIYQELALDFATKPFEETMDKCQSLVRKYYSCYPFLLQVCILWINHFMLSGEVARQQAILQQIAELCEHIIENCNEVGVCNDATAVKAVVNLQLGKAAQVVEALEEVLAPKRLSKQNEGVLIQAYQMLGEQEKAKDYTQISMYLHLLSMIGSGGQYLAIQANDLKTCIETMQRIKALIENYHVDKLHPNAAAQFYYQSALVYMQHGRKKEALEELCRYAKNVEFLLADEHFKLHGDSYFDSLDKWIAELDLGAAPPRNKMIVKESFLQSLEHPIFAELKDAAEFKRIRKMKG